MDWLLKFAEMDEDQKAKIIFHFLKIFIVSTLSLIIYKLLFGDFVILEFSLKNMMDFINSKFLFLALFSFLISWILFWAIRFLENLVAKIISNELKKFVNRNVNRYSDDCFNFRRAKRMIELSKLLAKYKFIKIKENKIAFPKIFILAKKSLAETQKVKNEAEKTYYNLSVLIIIFGLEASHYTEFYAILWISILLGLLSFLIATLYTFVLRNENMIIAIWQSIKQFTEKYEYH